MIAATTHRQTRGRRQSGVTLLFVLLILLVVTVLGVGAAQIVLMAERSARYDRDYQLAWQAAEAALMDAEFDLRGPNTAAASRVATFQPGDRMNFATGCNGGAATASRGLCLPNASGKQVAFTVDFMDTGSTARTVAFGTFTGRSFDAGGIGVKPAMAPRYIVEVLEDQSAGGDKRLGAVKPVLYRVSAVGFGPRDDTVALNQMVFRKEWQP